MKIEIVNQEGLFATREQAAFFAKPTIKELQKHKSELSLSSEEEEVFDEILTRIQKFPITSTYLRFEIKKQKQTKSYEELTQCDAYYWSFLGRFSAKRFSATEEEFGMPLWDDMLFIQSHEKKLKKWCDHVGHLLPEGAFKGVARIRKKDELTFRQEDPSEKWAFGTAYAVFRTQTYQGRDYSGYLDSQTTAGSLANARLFESEKAIEMAAKKNKSWGQGFVVKVQLEAQGPTQEAIQELGGFSEVLPLIERKKLVEKLNIQAEQEEKYKALVEKVRETHPEWLEEVGLTVSKPKKRM